MLENQLRGLFLCRTTSVLMYEYSLVSHSYLFGSSGPGDFPFHVPMSIGVVNFRSCSGSHTLEACWVPFLSFLRDTVSKQISYSPGSYTLSIPSSAMSSEP